MSPGVTKVKTSTLKAPCRTGRMLESCLEPWPTVNTFPRALASDLLRHGLPLHLASSTCLPKRPYANLRIVGLSWLSHLPNGHSVFYF